MSAPAEIVAANARARGLSTHLLDRQTVEDLAGQDVGPLSQALSRHLHQPLEIPPSAASIDSMVRHAAAGLSRQLARWPGSGPALEVFEADQDRRAARAMLRGAAQGAPMQQRLEGLLPTMALPERALSNLARQPTPRLVVAHLVTLAFPGATGLIPLVSRAEPNLFELDLALVRAFAARGAKAAGGDRNLRAFVARRLDLCNVELALALARGSHELDASRCFVDGGALLGLAAFRDLCGAGGDAPRRLERVLRGTPLSAVVREADTPSRLERAFLKNELAIQRREMRTDPLTSAPLLSFLLRIEAQSTDLRRVSWGAALRTPGSALLPELVTPWT